MMELKFAWTHRYPGWKHNCSYRSKGSNEADLIGFGLGAEDLIEIESEHGAIIRVVQPTDEVKKGVISMIHCWGETPEIKLDVREYGVNTNRLINYDIDYEPITGLARMAAIPVAVRPFKD
jgi:hypothetical protein